MCSLYLAAPGPNFGKGKLARPKTDEVDGSSQSQASQGSEILRLKKRFMKDSDQSRLFFVKREARLKKLREVREFEFHCIV